jgi:hypothetical protein
LIGFCQLRHGGSEPPCRIGGGADISSRRPQQGRAAAIERRHVVVVSGRRMHGLS